MSEAADVLTDARGRKLTIRKLSVLEQVRLMRAIGPAQSSNDRYTDLVQVAAMISDIDGIPMPMPVNEKTIDGMIGTLGDEGFSAVLAYMRKQAADVEAAADAALLEAGKPADPLPPSETLPSIAT